MYIKCTLKCEGTLRHVEKRAEVGHKMRRRCTSWLGGQMDSLMI